jgi:hypothetical protein
MTKVEIGANIIAFIASVIMALSGIFKNKKTIIVSQTVQVGLFVMSNVILGSMSGAIINGISCVRNILCYKEKYGKTTKIVLTVSTVVLSLMFNNIGFIGLLPLIGTVIYTIFMDVKDICKFKYLLIMTMVVWIIHDIYIHSYTSAIFSFANIVANIISIYKIKKQEA